VTLREIFPPDKAVSIVHLFMSEYMYRVFQQ